MMAGACLLAGGAHAAVFAVDDSASIVQGGPAPMRWRSDRPGHGLSNATDGRARVHVVLNTQRWAGRHGRIYMLLAPQPVRFGVQWTCGGVLLPGRMEPGQRTLVYDGLVPGPALNDVMDLSISADGREFGMPQQLRFSYEIEVAP